MVGLSRIKRFLALNAADRATLARAFVYLTLVDVGQRVRGFERLIQPRQFTTHTDAFHTEETHRDLARAQGYARWLDVASRHHLFPAHCLHRSLALQLWLSRDGIDAPIRIGVRKQAGGFQAHAWVEVDGHVVNDDPRVIAAFSLLTQNSRADMRPLARKFANAFV